MYKVGVLLVMKHLKMNYMYVVLKANKFTCLNAYQILINLTSCGFAVMKAWLPVLL